MLGVKQQFEVSSTVEWGQPLINQELCTNCGQCVQICPTMSIQDRQGKPVVVKCRDFGCIACGHCMAVCPTGAVSVSGRGLKKEDAFLLSPVSERAGADSLQDLMDARRSIRIYEDKPIESQVIQRLVAMAATAPMGFPPTEVGVVIINDKKRVQALAADLCAVFKKWLFFRTPAGALMMRLIMDKPTRALMRDYVLPVTVEILEGRKQASDYLFYNAPCVIMFHYPMKDTVDSTIACSFMTLAAESLGLGSCIIGTVPPALEGNKKLMSKWGIPDDRHPSIAMVLGYPSFKFTNGIRRHFSSVKYL
ncbi:MAG: nitroreductase family protein [Candidatus Omnitrophica bacterium]|nr:nitroreductase family protein [Candidatus Omnitrophota bacterium]